MIDRVNRAVLLLLGAVLALAGGYAIVVGTGAADGLGVPALAQPGDVYGSVEDAVAASPRAWQGVLIAAAILAVLLGLRLVAAELRSRRPARRREVTVASADRGRTTVRAASIARTLARDLTRSRGVDEASVTARSLQRDARFDVVLTLARDTRLSSVGDEIEAAYDRTRTALGADRLDVRCRVVFSEARMARVR